MPQEESPVETFQRAVGSALRAIAGEGGEELQVSFGADQPQVAGDQVQLPFPARDLNALDVELVRGSADALALRLRYHDQGAHVREQPRGKTARAIYDAIEQTRVEALGASRLAGVAANLDSALEQRCRRKGYDHCTVPEEVPVAEALAMLMREKLTGRHLPQSARHMAGPVAALVRDQGRAAHHAAHPRDPRPGPVLEPLPAASSRSWTCPTRMPRIRTTPRTSQAPNRRTTTTRASPAMPSAATRWMQTATGRPMPKRTPTPTHRRRPTRTPMPP